ncbi:MAG: hypothetical protein ACXVBE_11910, partial [Bdellovibrionota bacterium]
FVFSKPGRELWLIGQRFLYIWGIKPDVWAIPPPFQNRTATETLFHTAACTLFFLGLYFSLTLPRGRESSDRRWIYLVLLAVLAPPMAMYGDQRFLIPVIPYVVMFQALALCTVYRRLAK